MGLLLGAWTVAGVAAILGGLVQPILPAPVRLAPLGLLAVVVLLREWGLISVPVPENARLVPEHVLHRGRVAGGIQFGFEMGTGMRTYSPSAQPHIVLAALLLAVPPLGALAAGLGFAVARWAMAAASVLHGADGEWSDLWQINARLLAAGTAAATVASLAFGVLPW
ncbi:hypothetical protein HS041_25355 [Planomonospora sp. ID67723]|uniref:hypothetical protein n=1 Tax=Planomonospora sp. ID67723 TaxID=2738134 RepID=UPI0018C3F58C|nr:hypothetical protein [Planomonospora sp. ID67723]MBG0831092.1 hypothetical protein [Planomonospora sp. ID67723]